MENTTPQGSNNAGNALNWLEKILEMEKKYGLRSIINGFLVLFIAIVVGVFAFNPTLVVRAIENVQEQVHQERSEVRKDGSPYVKTYLIDVREELGASRAFLFEAHNGGTNLNGLPFLYIDMTFDEPRKGQPKIQDEFKNTSQTRYDFIDMCYRTGFWYGTTEDIKDIDAELYYRYQKYEVKKVAFLVIYGPKLPYGAIGVEFVDDNTPDYNTVRTELSKTANKILLTFAIK